MAIQTIVVNFSALGYGQRIDKHRWGSKTKMDNVGLIHGKNASIQNFPFMVSLPVVTLQNSQHYLSKNRRRSINKKNIDFKQPYHNIKT